MLEWLGQEKAKILDLGCGQGEFVHFARSNGLDCFGVDTFEGIYESWESDNQFIEKIIEGKIPFLDGTFMRLISNQVLEHIDEKALPKFFSEIDRVLVLNGKALLIYPTKMTAVESHVGLPFAAQFIRFPIALKIYLAAAYSLGFGYWRGENKRGGPATLSQSKWVTMQVNALAAHCHYPKRLEIENACQKSNLKMTNASKLLLNLITVRIPLIKPLKYLPKSLQRIAVQIAIGKVLVLEKNP